MCSISIFGSCVGCIYSTGDTDFPAQQQKQQKVMNHVQGKYENILRIFIKKNVMIPN